MQKRGQGGEIIKYFIIAITIVGVVTIGYTILANLQDNSCTAELAQFEISLRDINKKVKFGAVKEFTLDAPCGATNIFFFDINENASFGFPGGLPLVEDSIRDKEDKNVFIVKGDGVLDSFYAGDIIMEYPHYLCFLPKQEKINFFLEGKGATVSIIPGCFQSECTYIPVDPEEKEAIDIIVEAVEFSTSPECTNCPTDEKTEYKQFAETRDNIQILRKYELCEENGTSTVEIIVRPKPGVIIKDFRYYESIPKNCVADLNAFLSSEIEGEVSIKADPLIIWSIDSLEQEARLTYELKKIVSEECREIIEGLGIAAIIEQGNSASLTSYDKALDDLYNDYMVVASQVLRDNPYADEEVMEAELLFSGLPQQIVDDILGGLKIMGTSGAISDVKLKSELKLQGIPDYTIGMLMAYKQQTPSSSIGNTPPVFLLPEVTPSIQFSPDYNKQLMISNLNDFAQDLETPQSLAFTVKKQSSPTIVNCEVIANTQLVCEVKQNTVATAQITIEVFDGFASSSDSITLNVVPLCTTTCGGCRFDTGCSEQGVMTCVQGDCLLDDQPCTRSTGGQRCSKGICEQGVCKKEKKQYTPGSAGDILGGDPVIGEIGSGTGNGGKGTKIFCRGDILYFTNPGLPAPIAYDCDYAVPIIASFGSCESGCCVGSFTGYTYCCGLACLADMIT